MRWVQFGYTAILGLLILPFLLIQDLWWYRGFLGRVNIKERGWKDAWQHYQSGGFQAVMAYWGGLRMFFYDYEHVKFRWMPLRYVRHTSAWDETCYCRVLYGGVCWWGSFGRGPGYIGGYAIVLTGCLDGWKFNGRKRLYMQRWSWWRAMVVGRA